MNPSLEPGRAQDNPLRVSPSRPDYGAPERGQGSLLPVVFWPAWFCFCYVLLGGWISW